MHALTLKFSRRVGGLMLHPYLNPILLSFQKKKKKREKEQEQKIRKGKIITSKKKKYIFRLGWSFGSGIEFGFHHYLSSSLRYISFLTLCNVTSKNNEAGLYFRFNYCV
ncbi:hypothetical protein AABB24_012171 [Solanum stoloniferum]|uniref:Uncharacterized protein n=1 Tax=Solanum stoloniferum TaxID=62892 RepID=A0ABD2U2R8_9SOLN